MDSAEVTLEVIGCIEEALDLGYTKIHVNVDNLENGTGFLRVLAMYECKYIQSMKARLHWNFVMSAGLT